MRFRDTLLRGASLWSMISALDKQEPFVSNRRAIVVVKHYRTQEPFPSTAVPAYSKLG